ncbi:hypothetical protein ACTG13_13340 [Aeromonas hydrophila]|uniref:hypothetical protein n=1 Tax=Aeromonas hydrophila TaxID=644 RepID=UPI003F78AF72
MSDRYFGKVVHISDNFSVVINAGEAQNVKVGMKFLIVGLGDLILDPDTGEELEQLEIVRGRAEVVHVQARLSTLKSIETERQPDTREIKKVTSRNAGLASLIGSQDVVTESIKPSEPILLELNNVCLGDYVIKI